MHLSGHPASCCTFTFFCWVQKPQPMGMPSSQESRCCQPCTAHLHSVGDIHPTSQSNAGSDRTEDMGEDKGGDSKLQYILLIEAEDEEEPQRVEEEDSAEPAAKHCCNEDKVQ